MLKVTKTSEKARPGKARQDKTTSVYSDCYRIGASSDRNNRIKITNRTQLEHTHVDLNGQWGGNLSLKIATYWGDYNRMINDPRSPNAKRYHCAPSERVECHRTPPSRMGHEGNQWFTDGFPSQRANDGENIFMSRHHRDFPTTRPVVVSSASTSLNMILVSPGFRRPQNVFRRLRKYVVSQSIVTWC